MNVQVEHSIGIDCVEDITEFGLKLLIKCATHVAPNSSSTIDLVFSNIKNVYGAGCLTGLVGTISPYTHILDKKKNQVGERGEQIR